MEHLDWYHQNYHIITYGCQMNKNDSERLSGMLDNLGYAEVANWKEADLVILNTCSIRDRAERRVVGQFQILDHYRRKEKKSMKLAIAGCMPQHAKDFLLKEIPYIDYIVGVNNMEILPEFIKKNPSLSEQIKALRPNRRQAKDVTSFEKKMFRQKRITGSKAWVSIMFGCDKFCTYCIVPFTRGREMSRTKEAIFKEILSLQDKGIDQVVLLGQNVNSYGLTIYRDYDFADLLKDITMTCPWIKKIDFITSHPKDMNEKLINVIAEYPSISREIHFPLQHGDDDILRAMNRGYSLNEYLQKVDLLRRKVPGVKIGTDLIVGFPGETEVHFQNLLDVCQEIKFDYANTAAFSIRPGTKAAKLSRQIHEETKKFRLNILNRLLNNIYQEKGVLRPVLG